MRTIPRLLALLALCVFAVPIMGSGTECPKRCTIVGAGCAPTCGAPLSAGKCVLNSAGTQIICEGIDDPVKPIFGDDDELFGPGVSDISSPLEQP